MARLGPDEVALGPRYRDALKVALRWIKNYVELDFRSLATYTRDDLARIASSRDAF